MTKLLVFEALTIGEQLWALPDPSAHSEIALSAGHKGAVPIRDWRRGSAFTDATEPTPRGRRGRGTLAAHRLFEHERLREKRIGMRRTCFARCARHGHLGDSRN